MFTGKDQAELKCHIKENSHCALFLYRYIQIYILSNESLCFQKGLPCNWNLQSRSYECMLKYVSLNAAYQEEKSKSAF